MNPWIKISDQRIEAIHQTTLRVLGEVGPIQELLQMILPASAVSVMPPDHNLWL